MNPVVLAWFHIRHVWGDSTAAERAVALLLALMVALAFLNTVTADNLKTVAYALVWLIMLGTSLALHLYLVVRRTFQTAMTDSYFTSMPEGTPPPRIDGETVVYRYQLVKGWTVVPRR